MARLNGLKDSNFLIWTGVRSAVPQQLRIRGRQVNRDRIAALQFQIGDNFFNPALSKSRDFTLSLYQLRRQNQKASQS